MSNRTLVEFNHDRCYEIERDADFVVELLARYMRGLDKDAKAELLALYGIRIFGTRHHGDAFDIDWGGYKASESRTP